MLIKRLFDIIASLGCLLLLSPLFVLISLLILFDSRGGICYLQRRVGLGHQLFTLYKFRTMHPQADKLGLLTIGEHDYRITRVGYWLRKYKLDELPQLLNILIGDMSFVGPRPEVEKYVNLYTGKQLKIFSIKPGLTDWASIKYFNENEMLAGATDPEALYLNQIMPSKISQNLDYIDRRSFWMDLSIIYYTLKRCLKR
jgi:lipopolysaccharide/colanic/teichoic acid biosynthesis glycosyltransferase